MILATVDLERVQQTTIEPWEVILAVVVLILAWLLSRMTRRGIRRLADRLQGFDDELVDLAGRIASYAVLFVGIGTALSVLGAPIQPLLAAAVIFGIVLAISLRGIADNFASGVVIQARGTIRMNEEITALGYQGRVTELNGRAVVVETADGALVHLPNAKILSNPYANLSRQGVRRSQIEIMLDTLLSTGILPEALQTVSATPGVVLEPAPEAHVVLTEPDGSRAVIGFWHSPEGGREVRSAVLESLSGAFPRATLRAVPDPNLAPPPPPSTPA